MNYFFDTSALVVHALDLPGAAEVQSIMDQEEAGLFASALSLFELAGVLKRTGAGDRTEEFWRIYAEGLEIVAADAPLTCSAWILREKVGQRIPIADAIIAASAQAVEATLVHRDVHLARIPESFLLQIHLPAEEDRVP